MPFLLVRWFAFDAAGDADADDGDDGASEPRASAAAYHSLIVRVPSSGVVFEIVSARAPGASAARAAGVTLFDAAPRLPPRALARARGAAPGSALLLPLAVSKAVADLDAAVAFYEALGAERTSDWNSTQSVGAADDDAAGARTQQRRSHESSAGLLETTRLATLALPSRGAGSAVPLRLVERSEATDGARRRRRRRASAAAAARRHGGDGDDGDDDGAGDDDASAAAADDDDGDAALTVAELEAAKWAAHAASWSSPSCGLDNFYDNHFAWQQFEIPVDHLVARLERRGATWHCAKVSPTELDVYAVDPTGDAVQIDGDVTSHGAQWLHDLGCYNSSNVLFHLCSQGDCRAEASGGAAGGNASAPGLVPLGPNATANATNASMAAQQQPQQQQQQQQQQPQQQLSNRTFAVNGSAANVSAAAQQQQQQQQQQPLQPSNSTPINSTA